jgi:hypothetical protein
MDKILAIVGALLVIALIAGAGMVAMSTGNTAGFTKDSAIRAASDLVSNDATYTYDGMHGTLQLDAQKVGLETYPPQEAYLVTVEFTSAHAGYGDRSGMMTAEVLTSHTCAITVTPDLKVTSAVMDGQWDMLRQQML